MSTIKKTAEDRSRATPAAAPRQARGTLTKKQKWTLLDYARKAYAAHQQADLTDGLKFDAWRKREVMAAVGKDGLTACSNSDFLGVKGHFQTLAGDLAGAFDSALKSGKPTDHAAPGDTTEARRQLVHTIATRLEGHIAAGGTINVGYVVHLARQKTRRRDLTLGTDWKSGLAERCTVQQLTQIRDTLINRINAADGKGDPATRNKSQKSPATKAAREQKMIDPRW